MELRPYQADAVKAAYAAMKSTDPALIVLPTGAGKSAVISTIALDVVTKWKGRVIILSHVRELIGQIANTIKKINWQAPVGIYSAGFSKKNGREKITVAGIQLSLIHI
jgi:DNA repair protein RadD